MLQPGEGPSEASGVFSLGRESGLATGKKGAVYDSVSSVGLLLGRARAACKFGSAQPTKDRPSGQNGGGHPQLPAAAALGQCRCAASAPG